MSKITIKQALYSLFFNLINYFSGNINKIRDAGGKLAS